MPQIYVCPLAQIPDTVRLSGARSLLTLINHGTEVPRPEEIAPERHRFVAMSDIIIAEDGHILPAEEHVEDVLAFVRAWDRAEPLVIHCWAGVSRSTAAAYIAACALDESRCEFALARELRQRSPTATPNARMIEIADRLLAREGRMIEAIASIGRGEDCFEGVPFSLDLNYSGNPAS
ncbi:MAG: protein tyrosine phosphatase [Beijerinckiaceae bacterium]